MIRVSRTSYGCRDGGITGLHIPECFHDLTITHAHHVHAAHRLGEIWTKAVTPANDGVFVDADDVLGCECAVAAIREFLPELEARFAADVSSAVGCGLHALHHT